MPDADPIRIVRSDVGSYLKLVGQVVMWEAQSLFETGLTDLPKPG